MRKGHLGLPWENKAEHLNRYAWQLMVSGYSESYSIQVIKGVMKRYLTLPRDHLAGHKSPYRSRVQIVNKLGR